VEDYVLVFAPYGDSDIALLRVYRLSEDVREKVNFEHKDTVYELKFIVEKGVFTFEVRAVGVRAPCVFEETGRSTEDIVLRQEYFKRVPHIVVCGEGRVLPLYISFAFREGEYLKESLPKSLAEALEVVGIEGFGVPDLFIEWGQIVLPEGLVRFQRAGSVFSTRFIVTVEGVGTFARDITELPETIRRVAEGRALTKSP